jgi:hypothetical protein
MSLSNIMTINFPTSERAIRSIALVEESLKEQLKKKKTQLWCINTYSNL